MAYEYTVDTVRDGPRIIITINETDAEETSEAGGGALPIRVPRSGRIERITCERVSGDAATISPSAYSEPGGAFLDSIFEGAGGDPDVQIDDAAEWTYSAPSGRMYWRSTPNAGTNNVVTSIIIIRVD